MVNFENLEDSIELPIGTRFYFRHHIYEVTEANESRTCPWGCSKCAFNTGNEEEICLAMICDGYRHDKKYIYFKEVKETGGGEQIMNKSKLPEETKHWEKEGNPMIVTGIWEV